MSPNRIAHPIPTAWISTGDTGAQNYDEFADDAEIEAIIRDNPSSILAVDMPHCSQQARGAGRSFHDCLPAAAEELAQRREDGHYRSESDVVIGYRIHASSGTAFGVMCMVDTDQISAAADQPGAVIRNEDVFLEKVRERMALTDTLKTLLSPVLLLASEHGTEVEKVLGALIDELGAPAISDTDQLDQLHEMWVLPAGPTRDQLLDLISTDELIVADGNHRTLAAQEGTLPRFLAVVTTPDSVHIRPYNRLIRDLGMEPEQFLDALRSAGCDVQPWEGAPGVPPLTGTIALHLGVGHTYAVALPEPDSSLPVVERLDHAVVERLIVRGALGLDPGDKKITYVGGDYPVEWLSGEVDHGHAAAALIISPVSVEDFVAVNLARQKMPRKSTWFTPKARTGLVLADL